MFSPGLEIGSYRIEEKIGEGGMGMVFRALDTKLNRPVAIKVLSDDLADTAARRRFQREAQTASALNHPHIVTVHDAGEFEGRQYLVTEFIDGGTLRGWARAEKRAWREVIEMLVGVADGLAAAHAAGILHRDLKPENILITRSGYAKLADFGLAKLAESQPQDETRTLTQPGMVVGTIAYMSPEQATGRNLDARSDIFSFGTVLYEQLAGRRPFAGGSDLETLQKVVHEAPRPLSEEVPAGLRVLVEKALAKDPKERYLSMQEMVVELRGLLRDSARRSSGGQRTALAGVAAAILVVAGVLAWREWRNPGNVEPLQAAPLTTLPGGVRYPTFSPSGNHVAFTWIGEENNPDVYVQQIGAGTPLRLTTDPGNDYNPVWSPDDRWIAFLRAGQEAGKSELRLVPPLGGPERKLAEINVRGGVAVTPPYLSWCPDSTCLLATDAPKEGLPDAVFVISAETGEKRQLTAPKPPAGGDSHAILSDDGRWLVFRRHASGLYAGELLRQRLERDSTGFVVSGEPQRLTAAELDAEHPTWIPGTHEILFSSFSTLWRLDVDEEGAPVRLPFVGEDGLMPVVSRAQARDPSRLVYVRSFRDGNIWRVGAPDPGAPANSRVPAVASTRNDGMPHLAPNDRRVAFTSDRSGRWEIWLADLNGSNAVQLTSMRARATGYPRWSPDGESVAFHSNLEGQWEVYVIPAAGGKPRNITTHAGSDSFPSFSRDGKWVYFDSDRSGEFQIWKVPAAGGAAVRVIDHGYAPAESPDGKYLYFVQSFDTASPLMRVPTQGGAAEKILDGVVLANFAVTDTGIYYIDRPPGQASVHYVDQRAEETRLQYFDLATRKSTTVAGNLGTVDLPISASSDGRVILFARMDSSFDDLMLVENFR